MHPKSKTPTEGDQTYHVLLSFAETTSTHEKNQLPLRVCGRCVCVGAVCARSKVKKGTSLLGSYCGFLLCLSPHPAGITVNRILNE